MPGGGRPLIITEDPLLLDDLLRLCAAAGAEPHVHHAVPDPVGAGAPGEGDGENVDLRAPAPGSVGWESAPLVLVGDDAARQVAARPAGTRSSSSAEIWTTHWCGSGRWRSAQRRC